MNVAHSEGFATSRQNRGEGCIAEIYAWIKTARNEKVAGIHASG